jgi:hypothetical protein
VTPSGRRHTAAELAQRDAASRTPGGHHTAFFDTAYGAEIVQQQQQRQQQSQQQQQQQRQQQQDVAAEQRQLLQAVKARQQTVLQVLHDVSRQYRAVAEQLAAADQLSEDANAQLRQQLQELGQQQQQHELELTAVAQKMYALEDVLQYLQGKQQQQQPPAFETSAGVGAELGAEFGTAAAAARQFKQQQQQHQQRATFTQSAGLGPAELGAGQRCQPDQPTPLQQQQQQQRWPASRILQQMGSVDPLGSIMHPYTSGLGMSLNTQPLVSGRGAAVPAAGVASMFLELRDEITEVRSELKALRAAGAGQQPGTHTSSSDAAAAGPDGAVPCTGNPSSSWAAPGGNTAKAAAAAAEANGCAAAPAAGAAAGKGKKQKQKPFVRAFPSLNDMGSVKALAKFYFKEPLPERLIALDGVGPTNADNEPWTPALADKAGLEAWRGGRQGLFQRWYEIRFVAVQVKEKAKQLSATAGRGELPTVLDAAAALDIEREGLKMTLNKYHLYLKSGKGKVSSSSQEDEAGAAAGSGEDES